MESGKSLVHHANKYVCISVWAVYALQYVNLPGLGNTYVFSKGFLFALLALTWAVVYFRTRDAMAVPPAFLALVALWGLFFASALIAPASYDSLLSVALFGVCLLFCLLLTNSAADGAPLFSTTVRGLLLCGTVTAALGLFEFAMFVAIGPGQEMLIPYLLPPNVGIRVGGPYGQPNHLALFLGLALVAFFYHYLHEASHPPQVFPRLRYLPVGLTALVFFLTGSRSGLVSLAVVLGTLSWLVFSGRYLKGRSRREFYILLGSVAAGWLCSRLLPGLLTWMFAGWTGSVATVTSVALPGVSNTASSDGRYLFWVSSVLIFMANPWLGVGLDNFRFHLPPYQVRSHDVLGFIPFESIEFTNWSHNEFLQVLCEGGIFAFLLAVGILVAFFVGAWRHIVGGRRSEDRDFLYGHLFLLLFVAPAMLGWSLRNIPLLVLFFLLMALLLAQYPLWEVRLSPAARSMFSALAVAGILMAGHMLVLESRLGALKYSLRHEQDIRGTFPTFERLSLNPFCEYTLLTMALPFYVADAFEARDEHFANQLQPYAGRIARLRGVPQDWYTLARLYLLTGNEPEASAAIRIAIDRHPAYRDGWALMHYLNVLVAARKTGQPLDSFFPEIEGGEAAVKEYFYGRNRPARRQQDI